MDPSTWKAWRSAFRGSALGLTLVLVDIKIQDIDLMPDILGAALLFFALTPIRGFSKLARQAWWLSLVMLLFTGLGLFAGEVEGRSPALMGRQALASLTGEPRHLLPQWLPGAQRVAVHQTLEGLDIEQLGRGAESWAFAEYSDGSWYGVVRFEAPGFARIAAEDEDRVVDLLMAVPGFERGDTWSQRSGRGQSGDLAIYADNSVETGGRMGSVWWLEGWSLTEPRTWEISSGSWTGRTLHVLVSSTEAHATLKERVSFEEGPWAPHPALPFTLFVPVFYLLLRLAHCTLVARWARETGNGALAESARKTRTGYLVTTLVGWASLWLAVLAGASLGCLGFAVILALGVAELLVILLLGRASRVGPGLMPAG